MDESIINKEIKPLSQNVLSQIVNALERAKKQIELNPTNSLFYYSPLSNEECGVLRKLMVWNVLEFVEDDLGEGPFLRGNVNDIQKAINLLTDRIIQIQSGEQAAPVSHSGNIRRKTPLQFDSIPLNYLKQERSIAMLVRTSLLQTSIV